MIHLTVFSDHRMTQARALCISSALRHGVESVAGPHYFDPGIEYRDGFTLEWLKSQSIYGQMGEEWWNQRSCGYWLWKPYIVDMVMSKLREGDILIYADAGVEFIDNTRYIVDRMGHDKPQNDIFLFGNNWEHAHWCKRDVVEAVWPQPRPTNEERITSIVELEQAGRSDILEAVDAILTGEVSELVLHDILWNQFGKQCQASVIFFRVSDYSRKFVKEWLDWCLFEGGRLIDDSPSRTPNHPEFSEHRHDQAILTTLAYREGIKLHYWPAMYNDGAFNYEKLPCYAEDDYPILFHHHRRRDIDWEQGRNRFNASARQQTVAS